MHVFLCAPGNRSAVKCCLQLEQYLVVSSTPSRRARVDSRRKTSPSNASNASNASSAPSRAVAVDVDVDVESRAKISANSASASIVVRRVSSSNLLKTSSLVTNNAPSHTADRASPIASSSSSSPISLSRARSSPRRLARAPTESIASPIASSSFSRMMPILDWRRARGGDGSMSCRRHQCDYAH